MNKTIACPEFLTEHHLIFLDDLREIGEINMFEATLYIQDEFLELSRDEAKEILIYWMKTFGDRYSD